MVQACNDLAINVKALHDSLTDLLQFYDSLPLTKQDINTRPGFIKRNKLNIVHPVGAPSSHDQQSLKQVRLAGGIGPHDNIDTRPEFKCCSPI